MSSQNGPRNNRYQQVLRSTENNQQHQSRFYPQANVMPQIAANLLPKTVIAATNSVLDSSIRTKSANTLARQRTGLLG
jgi:hypothetical protein